MAQLRRQSAKIAAAGARMIMISFQPREQVARYCRALELPMHCISDPDRRLYKAYGLARSLRGWLISLKGWLRIPEYVARREARLAPTADRFQMGGDFVIGEDGRLLLAHPSRTADDRPSVDTLVRLLTQSPPEP